MEGPRGQQPAREDYADPSRWASVFQTYVQFTVAENHTKATTRPVKVMERSIFSSQYCFAQNMLNSGKLDRAEFAVAQAGFQFLKDAPGLDTEVDLIIYLRTSPEKSYERVKARGRGEEQQIPLGYLEELHSLHDDWLIHEKFPVPARVVIVDADQDREAMRRECSRVGREECGLWV